VDGNRGDVTLRDKFRALADHLGFLGDYLPSDMRAGFATEWLARGGNLDDLQ